MDELPKRHFKVMDVVIVRNGLSRVSFYIDEIDNTFGIEDSVGILLEGETLDILVTAKDYAGSGRYFIKGLVMDDLKKGWKEAKRVATKVKAFIEDVSSTGKEVWMSDTLRYLGFDELDVYSLRMSLEEEYGEFITSKMTVDSKVSEVVEVVKKIFRPQ